jgi:proteasome lid subunit RPN8/RPN11
VIKVTEKQLEIIRNHAENTYPDECCGFLMGEISHSFKTLLEVWPTANSWAPETAEIFTEMTDSAKLDSSKRSRFAIDPSAMLKAMKEGRDRHLTIIGIYHSHPNHPAIPSTCDRAYAWPEYSYIIVSVNQGIAQNLLNWRLDEDSNFQPEKIIILESTQVKN